MLSGLFAETQTFRLHRAPTRDQREDQEPRLVEKQKPALVGELSPGRSPGTPFICESSRVYLYQGYRQRHFICC